MRYWNHGEVKAISLDSDVQVLLGTRDLGAYSLTNDVQLEWATLIELSVRRESVRTRLLRDSTHNERVRRKSVRSCGVGRKSSGVSVQATRAVSKRDVPARRPRDLV